MIKFTKTELNDLLIDEIRNRKQAEATADSLRNTIAGLRNREKLYVENINTLRNEIYDVVRKCKVGDRGVKNSIERWEYNGMQNACELMLQAIMRAS